MVYPYLALKLIWDLQDYVRIKISHYWDHLLLFRYYWPLHLDYLLHLAILILRQVRQVILLKYFKYYLFHFNFLLNYNLAKNFIPFCNYLKLKFENYYLNNIYNQLINNRFFQIFYIKIFIYLYFKNIIKFKIFPVKFINNF